MSWLPQHMLAHCNFKLISSTVADYLQTPIQDTSNNIHSDHVVGALYGCKNLNGLMESHWKKINDNCVPLAYFQFSPYQVQVFCHQLSIQLRLHLQ